MHGALIHQIPTNDRFKVYKMSIAKCDSVSFQVAILVINSYKALPARRVETSAATNGAHIFSVNREYILKVIKL